MPGLAVASSPAAPDVRVWRFPVVGRHRGLAGMETGSYNRPAPRPAATIRPNLGGPRVSDRPGELVEAQRSTITAPDDAALVRRTLGGQRPAFDELIERYQQRATSVAYRLLGNIHDALEVCQESFVRAYRKLDTLEDPHRFGPWLLRIVTNLSLNSRRSRGPRLSLEGCLVGEDGSREERVSDKPHSADRPGAQLAASELQERIHVAMAELPPQQRTALVLFSIEQLPQREVAQIMACSVEAVKWHVFQARKKMKVHLAEFL